MALKPGAVSRWNVSQVSWSRTSMSKQLNFGTSSRLLPPGAIRSELSQFTGKTVSNASRNLLKDFSSFPRPLSVADISADCDDDVKVRISFKGLPGSYSEDAALKAYPKSETVPCDEFEDAFKAVELWLADKAILPIECSSNGSIHPNYDLLLRHRLHITGEVQLNVNMCLLAMPGVRTEQLKRVLSHPQYVASNKLRDAGAVASARASELYGLNILAEKIQGSDNSKN